MDHSRIVERALFIFKDEIFMEKLGSHAVDAMEPLVSALLRGGEQNWNSTVTKAR